MHDNDNKTWSDTITIKIGLIKVVFIGIDSIIISQLYLLPQSAYIACQSIKVYASRFTNIST